MLLCAAQGTCIAAYRDPCFYIQQESWSILVPLTADFVKAILVNGLDALLVGPDFDRIHGRAQAKCAVGHEAFSVDRTKSSRRPSSS